MRSGAVRLLAARSGRSCLHGSVRSAAIADSVKPVCQYSAHSARAACMRSSRDYAFHVISQRFMLNWHFVIYNKLCLPVRNRSCLN